jgi:hypothetical protein
LFNDAKGNTAAANIVEYSDEDYELFGLVGQERKSSTYYLGCLTPEGRSNQPTLSS